MMCVDCGNCLLLIECAMKCQELGKTQIEICPCKEAED